jgi:hypothetical protein
MPIGISEALNEKFGTKPAGKPAAGYGVFGANFSPSPNDEIARRVEAALEVVVAGGPVEVVAEIVFARPQQLDRRAVHLARDPRGFRHVVVEDAAAHAAPHAHEVDRDVALLHAERLRDDGAPFARRLRADPDFELAVLVMGRAVLRLEGRVREERIVVRRFDRLRGARERRVGIAVVIELDRRRLRGELRRARVECLGVVGRRWPFVPRDLQLLARLRRMPPRLPDDGDATMQADADAADRIRPRQVRTTLDDEGVLHAGELLDLVDVRGRHLAAGDGALLVDGVEHSRQLRVDAVDRLAAHDPRHVDVLRRRSDHLVVLGILQRDGLQVWYRHRRRLRRELAVAERSVRRGVCDAPRAGRARRRLDAPRLRGRGHEHLPRGGAALAKRIPVDRCRRAAAGALHAEALFVERRIVDGDALPVHVELVGDDHRQVHLRALAALGILAEDRDRAVGMNREEGPRLVVHAAGGQPAAFLAEDVGGIEVDGEHQAAAGNGGGAEERAAIQQCRCHDVLLSAAR